MPKKPAISMIDDDFWAREATLDSLDAAGISVQAFQKAEDYHEAYPFCGASWPMAEMPVPAVSGLTPDSFLIAAYCCCIADDNWPGARTMPLARGAGP